MRTCTRLLPLLGLAALLLGAVAAGPAAADEPKDDPHAGLGRAEAILRGLASGIEALRMLGGQEEEIARLEEIRARVERRVAEARRGQAEKREAGGEGGGIVALGDDDEKRALSRRADLLRAALRALKMAERRDAAEMVARAVHTAELLLAGRKDAEAQAAYERTPKLAVLSKVLQTAADLFAKHGHEEDAAGVAELARFYAKRAKQQAAEEDDEEGGDDDDEGDDEMEDEDEPGDRDADDDEDDDAVRTRRAAEVVRERVLAAQTEAQIAALRAQLAELQRMLEKLRAEVEALGAK